MKNSIYFWAALVCLPWANIQAQAPLVKGHLIGEPVAQFLRESPALQNLSTYCQTNPGNNELFGINTCEDVLDAVNGKGRVVLTERGVGELLGRPSVLDYLGYAEFTNGTLTMIGLNQYDTWDVAYRDLIKKFGRPTSEGVQEAQNGYGAKFTLPNAKWVRSGYSVFATDNFEYSFLAGNTRFVLIELATASRVKEISRDEEHKKNSLD